MTYKWLTAAPNSLDKVFKGVKSVILFIFLSLSFTASSECQAHGVRQHANADGDDVEATLFCLWHWRPPIWPEPSQPPHSLQCSSEHAFVHA